MRPLGFIHRLERGEGPHTLLLLHGTGGDETSLLGLGRALAPKAHLLAPRGQVLEGRAPRYFRRLAPGVFDPEELHRRAQELAGFIGEAAQVYGLDPGRVYALGYSNGANMAALLFLLHPGVLAGGALLRPMLPLRPQALPDLRGRPILLLAGQEDPLVPRASVEALAQVLAEAKARVELRFLAAGHGLTPEDLEALRAWARSLEP